MKDSLKQTKLYKSLGKFSDKFDNIFEFLKAKSNDKSPLNRVYFTPHDAVHCSDIFHIISDILNFKKIKLIEEESFVLAISVFLHDVGMNEVELNMETRDNHMINAAKNINEYRKDNLFSTNIDASFDEPIKKICLCHSDIKDKVKAKRHASLQNLKDNKKVNGETLRLRLLAALLRLGDELDICADRIGNNKLASGDASSFKTDEEKNEYLYSLSRWNQLELFGAPLITEEDIKLNINDEKFSILKETNGSKFPPEKLVNDHYVKVEKSYNLLKPIIEEYFEFSFAISFGDCNEEIISQIEIYRTSNSANEKIKDRTLASLDNTAAKIVVIDKSFEVQITDLVKKYKLLEFGHYKYAEGITGFCCRDYINTAKIIQELNNNDIEEKIAASISSHEKFNKAETLILGIDTLGFILAAGTAFQLGVKFARYNSSLQINNDPDKSMKKLESELKNAKDVILIFDVVSTGLTAQKIITFLETIKQFDSIKIYCLFYKPYNVFYKKQNATPSDVFKQSKDFLDKTTIYTICDEYYSEFIENKDCPYKEAGQCYNCTRSIK